MSNARIAKGSTAAFPTPVLVLFIGALQIASNPTGPLPLKEGENPAVSS